MPERKGDSWFDDLIKEFRKGLQREANEFINEAEEALVKEVTTEVHKHFPDIPDAVLDKLARQLYWKVWDGVKERFDADWIKDT